MTTWLHSIQEDREVIEKIASEQSKKKLLKLIARNCCSAPDPKELKRRLKRFGGIRLIRTDYDVTISIGDEWSIIDNH